MPLVDMHDMLNHAYRNGYAVGCFDPASLDFVEAIVQAAEDCRSPVILGLAESRFGQNGFAVAVTAAEKAGQCASVPVALHLDRGASYDSAVRAINLGCNGVLVDVSRESFPANVAQTRRVAEMAHACGVTAEGTLGHVAGVDGEFGYTSVEEAKAYVARTGVDCLVVSVGSANGRHRGKPKSDGDRFRRLQEAVKIPLVVHANAGIGDEQFHRLISHGVAKINYAIQPTVTGEFLRTHAHANGGNYSSLLGHARETVTAEVEHVNRLFGAAGRAAEVLARCRPWRPVEHVILYNVEAVSDADVEAMMARGRELLSGIPGVRRVITGWAVTEKPRYRFCWLVEFTHEKVIASYRDHPVHVAFANELFRQVAGDRISIDFAEAAGYPEASTANGAKRARA